MRSPYYVVVEVFVGAEDAYEAGELARAGFKGWPVEDVTLRSVTHYRERGNVIPHREYCGKRIGQPPPEADSDIV